mgnify:CR=1 FL=1
MADPRVKMNRRGARAVLQSAEVQADLRRRTRAIASAAGPGMVSEVEVGPNRARGEVRTATSAARKREAESKALTRSLDAGRL